MRILYVSPSGRMGGAEVCLLDMLCGMRAARPGWPLALISAEDGPLMDRARELGVETEVVPFPSSLAQMGDSRLAHAGARRKFLAAGSMALSGWSAAVYRSRLQRKISEFSPQVVHSNGLKSDVLSAWASPRRVPLIWHIHDYVASRPWTARLLRWHSKSCSLALTNSQSVAEDLRSCCGSKLKVRTLYNTVDLCRFSPEGPRAGLDAMANLSIPPPGTLRVGLVATMAWWKGHADFLRAIALLPAGTPVRGYVVGGPLYQTNGSQVSLGELRQLASELGIEDRVAFPGFVEDAASVMRALDVVVHASNEPEPFGRVILEAMACGKAVLTTNLGGATEFVQPGQNAIQFRPKDPAHLAECILRLVQDAALRQYLGSNGRRMVVMHFDRTRLVETLVPMYEELAATS